MIKEIEKFTNRLQHSDSSDQIGYQVKYFLDFISNNEYLNALINKSILNYKYTDEDLNKMSMNTRFGGSNKFENLENQASFCFQILKYAIKLNKPNFCSNGLFLKGQFSETKSNIINSFVRPISYYLIDNLNHNNLLIYLFERYKRRTEWFTKNELSEKYYSLNKNYEQFLEDDLRLFLYDNGIEYPFSTPSSVSGRADLLSGLESENPLVAEIKIIDKKKNYGRERIRSGFSQIIDYSNDYNKNVGFLVIYNFNEDKIEFNFTKRDLFSTPYFIFENKIFYFIVINCGIYNSASLKGKLKKFEVTLEQVLSNN